MHWRLMMTRKISLSRPAVALALIALMALSACEQKYGQCEGGVSDLSDMSNVTVQNPC